MEYFSSQDDITYNEALKSLFWEVGLCFLKLESQVVALMVNVNNVFVLILSKTNTIKIYRQI